MSRSVTPYDRSKIHPHALIEKIRPNGQVSAVSAVSRTSPIITSRASARNKILPSDYTDNTLEDAVRELLIECYNQIDITIEKYYYNLALIEKVKTLLKLLTHKCSNYIDYIFASYNNQDPINYSDFEWTFLLGKEIKYSKAILLKFLKSSKVSASSITCTNRKIITNLYTYLFIGTYKAVINAEGKYRAVDAKYAPEIMKGLLKKELLNITPLPENIKKIIVETPFSQPTMVPIQLSASRSVSQQQEKYPRQSMLGNLKPLPSIPETDNTSKLPSRYGGKAIKTEPTKLLFGKVRRIYKKSGDKKEYVKHKGLLITIKQYRDIKTRAPKNRRK
jgi:hypothetical protein